MRGATIKINYLMLL